MDDEARRLFEELGSSVAKKLAFRDTWVFVGAKGIENKTPFEQVRMSPPGFTVVTRFTSGLLCFMVFLRSNRKSWQTRTFDNDLFSVGAEVMIGDQYLAVVLMLLVNYQHNYIPQYTKVYKKHLY